jgi:hypothetical protein
VPLGSISASAAPLLYATDTTTQQLFVLSTTNGSASLVGDFGVPRYMADLAYDPIGDILYGTTTLTDCHYVITRTTGAATLIGSLGISLMHSLAISVVTGQSTLIGNIGVIPGPSPYDTISGLAYGLLRERDSKPHPTDATRPHSSSRFNVAVVDPYVLECTLPIPEPSDGPSPSNAGERPRSSVQ